MKNILKVLFICLIINSIKIYGLRRRCMDTGVLFSDKILHSSIIVYGESLGKRIYLETNIELLFNITFRVDCIFKGENIENQIEITEAGIKINRTACQWLDPGKFYVVFLEKCGLIKNLYCPVDFQERIVDTMTYKLLEKTCRLIPISPLHAVSNNCPNVSKSEFCPNNEIDIKIMPKEKNSIYINTSFNNRNKLYPELNITKSNNGLLIDQIADNPHNYSDLSKLISIWFIILAVNIAMFI